MDIGQTLDSRATMVYHRSHVGTCGEFLPQEPEEIGLVDDLQNDTVRDMYVCALGKFHCDLYLATSSDVGMWSMLGSLETMCMGEEIDEHIVTIEEHMVRLAIYKHHLEAQSALTSVTAAAPASAATPASASAPAVTSRSCRSSRCCRTLRRCDLLQCQLAKMFSLLKASRHPHDSHEFLEL